MKFRIVVIATIGFELACTGFAGDYKYLVGKGYRWVTVDGPYACSTEEEVRRITTHRTDATELQMVEDGQAYPHTGNYGSGGQRESGERYVAGKFGRNYQASMDLHKISRYASDSGYLRCYRNTGNLWSNCRRRR
jgi:hypothetical protein